tara:strand:- start:422 stop:757 length:336 start_codon:yes stop_codon:yes gene_type:complete
MNDVIFTASLIKNQNKKKGISDTFKVSMEKQLRPLSQKLDKVIKRIYELMKFPVQQIQQVLVLKKIDEEYQALRKEWNTYIDKMFLVLKKIGNGNKVLDKEAEEFYNEMYL